MSDCESDESMDWMEAELIDTRQQLTTERSFRKVYGAIGLLAFLYGLVYGVYLTK